MYIFDTDHLSVLERGGPKSKRLLLRLASASSSEVATSIVSYEEQVRGWLSYIAKAQTIEAQVEAYKELRQQLATYCTIPIIDFDNQAANEFQRLKKLYPRLGTMDLKIASIALVNYAVLLTRNSSDFRVITGLQIEDWT